MTENAETSSVLVTLGDARHLDAVKQVFAGAHFHGGWRGDYLLLAHQIPDPELTWFEERGIHVRRCSGFQQPGLDLTTPQSNKFWLFTREFLRWERVVYLDADVIVRGSIAELTRTDGFAAVFDVGSPALRHQFFMPQFPSYDPCRIPRIRWTLPPDVHERLARDYDMNARSFNGGVFAFPTEIISETLTTRLHELLAFYWPSVRDRFADQAILNLLFYRCWQELPLAYDLFPHFTAQFVAREPAERMDAVIFHCCTIKPWDRRNAFQREWRANLALAENIRLDRPRPAARTWTTEELARHDRRYRRRRWRAWLWFHLVQRRVGPMLDSLRRRMRSVMA